MTKLFSEIFEKILGSLDEEKLGQEVENNSILLQSIYVQTSDLFDWQSLFEKPLNFKVTEERCNQLKEKGRISLQKKNMVDALKCFTQFIRLSHQLPQESSKKKSLQQGYLNRSMIFYRVENYVRCLDDCDAAMYYGKDEENHINCKYVLYERKGKCYSGLGNKMHARKNFDQALEASEKANLPEKLHEAFKRQTNEALKKLEGISEGHQVRFDDNADVIANTDHLNHAKMGEVDELHPSMSLKTRITYSKDKGRYVVANQDIEIGETLLVENVNISYSYFDIKANCSKACHHCLSSICEYMCYYSPVVDGIGFCSWKCLNNAMTSYHPYERFLFQNYIKESGEEEIHCAHLFLAFKTIVRQPCEFYLQQRCLNEILKIDPLFVLQNNDNLTVKETHVKSLYNMETHSEDLPIEERIRIAIRCVVLLRCLKESNYFKNCTLDPEQELHFLKLLFHFQFSIAHSVLQIYRVEGDVSGDIPLTALGSGIFDDLILLNHSCASNTTRFYQDGIAILVAKRSIKKGEEITLNYGIHHHNIPKENRQELLLNKYKFKCRCEACDLDFPTIQKCSSKIEPKSLAKKLDKILGQYRQSFANGRLEDAKVFCVKYLRLLETSKIPYPHRNYEIGSIALNSCWWGLIAANQM